MKMQKLILMDDKLFFYLKTLADKEERSVNNLIVKILKEYQKRNEKEK